MSDSIPYLGSKISLISKSEIRYEGILYTIDAQESIIALAKVQSFGTEDRHVENPVPAKNEVYEYIIFRGTDIKKIEVCESPKQQLASGLHNDPAIVGLQQHAASSMQSSYQAPAFNRQPLGPIGSVSGPFYGGGYGQPQNSGFSIGGGSSQPSELSGVSLGPSLPPVNVAPGPEKVPSVLQDGSNEFITATFKQQSAAGPIAPPSQQGAATNNQPRHQDVLSGSRSSTPNASRKSPVSDAGVQVSPPPQDKRRTNNQRSPQERPQRGNMNRRGGGGQNNYQVQQDRSQYNQGQDRSQYNQDRGPYNQGQDRSQYNQDRGQYNQGQDRGQYNQGGQRHNQGYQGGYNNSYHQGYSGRGVGSGMRGGRGGPRRGPSQGGPRGGPRGGYNQGGNRQRLDHQIFAKEFDFEQANEEFEELRTQLAKTKISDTAVPAPPNGVTEPGVDPENKEEKKDDSGHETATTGEDSEDSVSSVYYDKAKSFFDSISCEALERSKGRSQRPDWRQERKINVQTFGVATARNSYYPRGRGGYYNNRGGYYNRNYNNQGYYRGNSVGYRGRGQSRGGYYNNRNHNSNSSSSGPSNNVNGTAGPSASTGSSSYASAAKTAPIAAAVK